MAATNKITQLKFLTWTLIAGLVQFTLLFINEFPFEIALKDAITSVTIVSIIAQILYLIQTHFHASQPVNFVNFGIILGFTVLYQIALNTMLSLWLGTELWTKTIFPYEGARAIIVFFMLTSISLYWWIHKNEENQLRVQRQLLEQERALKKAELDSIHQQLQPHFLFNSLNSIGALTQIEPKEAYRMIQLLSDFLRGTLKKDIQTLVPLKDEIDQVNLYLEIEKVRFGHRLSTQITQTEHCENAKLPALLLQPIIENAIKYGLYGSTGEITIKIDIKCDETMLLISVSSPFDTSFVEESKGKGFGLMSIRRRLSLFYGQQELLKTHKTENKFTTTLRIPQV